jgi:hypothetical protein
MMITRKNTMLAVCGLVTGLALAAGSGFAQRAIVVAAPVVETHPNIRAALKALREAKVSLEIADHDFAGHRVAALKDTDAAIVECEAALKVDPK